MVTSCKLAPAGSRHELQARASSGGDTFKFGITMMFISWLMILLWGETVLRWYGFTNGVFF
ncbi:hypothetical protein [Capnocytophaga gingivalis]|uniref:Uncharacterized protein n=1 Tax=Capnocytophaga gingivalis TaxID=1017 RepID=A0A250FUQ9_9FLAO|nr:hypothetical protein [Capnocytophaga gingivalis]ATA87808.1 hypothetical protein CGC50_12130 [Capnocytophaga gingivalis]MEB3013947.1 hypothetical protein [Capnocytophaga gingivalis]